MDVATQKRSTMEEYLKLEYNSGRRHNFYEGIVKEMTYTSGNHGRIVVNLLREIGIQAKKEDWIVYPSGRMLYVPDCRLNCYPDVMVVKGEPRFHRHSPRMEATLNPFAIIEVLSDSMEEKDRIDKMRCYRLIPSLQQYILIAQDQVYIDYYNRIEGSRWENNYLSRLDQSITIAGFPIQVEDIYLKVNWEQPEQTPDK